MAKSNFTPIATPRIVQETGPNLWLWGLALVALAVWTWQVFDYGRTHAGFDSAEQASTENTLQQRLEELEQGREELLFLSAKHERANQIDHEAAQAVRREIGLLQTELSELQREAAKLRSQVSDRNAKFDIADYSLRRLDEGERYHYGFILSRKVKSDRRVEGTVEIRVAGERDDKPVELPLADLSPAGPKIHKLGFKHFQKIEGEIQLPSGFTARELIIEVIPSNPQQETFSNAYDWVWTQG